LEKKKKLLLLPNKEQIMSASHFVACNALKILVKQVFSWNVWRFMAGGL